MKFMLMWHLLGTVVWVGGMFFAHQVLRPVTVAQMEPPARLALWLGVFKRFFPWVWLSVVTILASGVVMIGLLGGMRAQGLHVHIMLTTGVVMATIYCYVYFVLFARLRASVAAADWKAGGDAMARIRPLIGINLSLGLATVAIATAGAMLA